VELRETKVDCRTPKNKPFKLASIKGGGSPYTKKGELGYNQRIIGPRKAKSPKKQFCGMKQGKRGKT